MSIRAVAANEQSPTWQRILPGICLVATAVLGLIALLLFYLNRQTVVPPSWGSPGGARGSLFEWVGIIGQALVLTLVPALLGFLIVSERPGQRVGWLLILIGLIGAAMVALQEWAIYGAFTTSSVPAAGFAGWISNWAWIVLYAGVLLMLAIFPDGRFLSAHWRTLILCSLALFVLPIFVQASLTTPMVSAFQIDNPFFSFANEGMLFLLFNLGVFFMPLTILLVLGEIIARYRRSAGLQRQQMKWLLAGIALMAAMVIAGLSLNAAGYVIGDVMVSASFLAPLLGIGISLLRYRLYDIDIIIRRGLVYGLLTAVLVAIYFGVVLLAQTTFVAITGQESPLAIVVSTLIIAALFNPLRKRLQAFIDRRFYRSGYDAALALEQFAQTARDEVDLEHLTAQLGRVIQQSMQPESLSLWLVSEPAIHAENQGTDLTTK